MINALKECRLSNDYIRNPRYYQELCLNAVSEFSKQTKDANFIINSARECHQRCEYTKAKELYTEALNIMKKSNLSEQAECYIGLAKVCESLEEFVNAEEYYKGAVALIEGIDRKEDTRPSCFEILKTAIELAKFYQRQGRNEEANQIVLRKLVHLTEGNERRGKEIAEECVAVAKLSRYLLDDHSMAEKYYAKALAIAKQNGDQKEEALCCESLGDLFSTIGQATKARELYKKALVLHKENGDKRGEAVDCSNLGVALNRLGEYDKAEECIRRAIEIMELELDDNAGRAACYGNLANTFYDVGEYGKAKECCKKALAIRRESGDREGEAKSNLSLGTLHLCCKDYLSAKECCEQALAVFRDEISDQGGEAACHGNLGCLYFHLGQYAKAEEHYKISVAMNKAINNREGEIVSHTNIGSVFKERGDYEKAIEYYKRALAMCEAGFENMAADLNIRANLSHALIQAGHIAEAKSQLFVGIQKCEEIQGALKENDQYRITFAHHQACFYHMLTALLFFKGNPRDALYSAELGRARALEDLMATQYSIENQVTVNPQTWAGIEGIIEKERNCVCLYIAYFLRYIFLWILTAGKPLRFRLIDVNDCFVNNSFVLDVDHVLGSEAFRHMQVVSQDECEDRSWFPESIPPQYVWNQHHDDGLEVCRFTEEDPQENQQPDATHFNDIYRMVISPVVDLLDEPEIIFVPDRVFCKVPFSALKDESGKCLSETFRVRIVPSLTTLKLIQNSPADYHCQTGALIVGDPAVGEVLYKGIIENGPRLPFAREEAQMIGRLLGAHTLLGEAATKQAVLQRIGTAGLVHFATHGNDERGEIVLAPPPGINRTPEEEDYLLTMADVSKVRLRAKLVVLSCCHSASGQIRTEGVVGIARAFIGSGARSVLVAIWAIDDEATKQFMSRFYEHLVRGESASESLHQAMKWMRENGFSAVRQWAPFMLIGDNVTFDFEKKR